MFCVIIMLFPSHLLYLSAQHSVLTSNDPCNKMLVASAHAWNDLLTRCLTYTIPDTPAQDKGPFFVFLTFEMICCNIVKYGMNLKLEILIHKFTKVIKLNALNIWKSAIEYY